MAENQTSICNLALSRFGGGKINSLDDDSELARLLSINYDNCLESVLRAYPWNFARKIDTLALTDDTTPGYNYVYQYPVNCANVLKIYSEGNSRIQEKEDYKIISNGNEKFIATDVENAYIEYTYLVTMATIYDATFVKALSYLLASETCNALTGNSNKAQEMMQKYQMTLSEAQMMGGVESNNKFERPTRYIDGRR
jgi:hypothetical protein